MRTALTSVLVSTALLISASVAHAQEKGQVGISMGFPATIGVVWHPSKRIGIRPEFSVSKSSIEQTVTIGGVGVDGSAFTYGIGVSALLYVGQWDSLRAYICPRLSYNKASSTNTPSTSSITASKNSTSGPSLVGSFGVQYSLHRKFSVFGEAGFGYTSQTSTFTAGTTRSELDNDTWSSRAGVGVVFYF